MDGSSRNTALVFRAEATVEAVEIAMRAETADDLLPGERDKLLSYTGMGPLADLFDDGRGRFNPEFEAVGRKLKGLLSNAEYESVRQSILTSYYTDPAVIRAMVAAARSAGVGEDALVLEPGCGVGRFMDEAPDGWSFTGIERDRAAAKIAQLRHPKAHIIARDFRDVKLAQTFDLAIGNVPFGDVTYRYGGRKLPVADFFIVSALDALRPGGVAVLLASRYVLDKADDATRRLMGQRARLVDAVRLPSDMFLSDGAQVVTDILVFVREAEADDAAPWFSTVRIDPAQSGQTYPMNAFFEGNPSKVLGRLGERSHGYGMVLDVARNGDAVGMAEAWAGGVPSVFSAAPGPALGNDGEGDPTDAVEGTLIIGDDGVIRSSRNGKLEAVVSHGKRLSIHDKGIIAQRTAAKIRLVEQRERIIAAQKDGEAADVVDALRAEGLSLYNEFVERFGPINRTDRTTDAKGEERLRQPNLSGPFRHDPRHAVLMAMEDYDDESGAAKPGAVLLRDVVIRQEEPSVAGNAAEGLMISQTWRGRVDMGFIAALVGKSQDDVIAELGEKVFRDPETAEWLVADEYLSGRVVAKLREAKAAAELDPYFDRNVMALEAVQPEPLTEADIEIKLGAPVLRVQHVMDFAHHIFKVNKGIEISRPMPDMWRVSADYIAKNSVAASVDFGTARMNGIEILETALNQKRIVITDEVTDEEGKKKRVVNAAETMAATEKLSLMRESFRTWVFSDETRTKEIVDEYNYRFNGRRLRRYFGGHLDFPGLEKGRSLRPHQANAVWRALSSTTNTMLAHFVGSGKTLCIGSIAMKARQLGIAKRPMFVVPNHLCEQIGREISTFYPTSRVLVASPEDFTREGRQSFLAKISHGDFDLIVIGHSSFERIPVSPEAQETFIQEEIARLRAALAALDSDESGHTATRRAKRAIERQVQKAEDRLKEACVRKKDQGIVWEDLQIDALYVDEAHLFKNLSFATKMGGVRGLNPDGSQRADDLYMKVRVTEQISNVKGPVVFATATPIANSISEIWVFLRMLAPEILAELEIDSFDNFVATFAEVVTALEITPDGAGMAPASRLARFVNVPEMLLIWSSIADVVTEDMVPLPKPTIRGGKPETVAVPMTDEALEIQRGLVHRMERIKNGGIDQRADNALAVTTDGRLLGLDPRLVDAAAGPGRKIDAIADQVAEIWRETAAERGVQMIFSSLGVHPSKRTGFCWYDAMVDALVARGIPRDEIVTCREEVNSPAKEARVHADLRAGRKRVAIYNDAKGGVGLNIQERLYAMHIAEYPWRPADQEQRIGRIVRQGNLYPEVRVLYYITTSSFDARLLQLLEAKSRFVTSVMKSEIDARSVDDISAQSLSYAELKAIASGEPAFLAEAELAADIRKLQTLRQMFEGQQRYLMSRQAALPGLIAKEHQRVAALRVDKLRFEKHRMDGVIVNGTLFADKQDAGRALETAVLSAKMNGGGFVGTVQGFGMTVTQDSTRAWYLDFDTQEQLFLDVGKSAGGQLLYRVRNCIEGIGERLENAEARLDRFTAEQGEITAKIGSGFEHDALLDDLRAIHRTIEHEMTKAVDLRDRIALDKALEDHARLKEATRRAEKSAARKRDIAASVAEQIMAEAKVTAEGTADSDPVGPSITCDGAAGIADSASHPTVTSFAPKPRAAARKGKNDDRQLWLFPEVA